MAAELPDPQADVEQVIATYAGMVYRLAFARVRNGPDADDIFQDVFLSFVRAHPAFTTEEHRKAWLIRVTINACKKLALSHWLRNAVSIGDLHDEALTSPFSMPEENDLHRLLLKLPPNHRTVLHLFYYEDMSVDAISHAMNAKPATVRAWLTRARRELRQHVEEEENRHGQHVPSGIDRLQGHERTDHTKSNADPIDCRQGSSGG